MLKIKQSENGYWISENWTYLDTYKATIYKRYIPNNAERLLVCKIVYITVLSKPIYK